MLDEKTTNLAEDTTKSAQDLIEQSYLEASGYSIRRGSAIYTMFIRRLADYLQPVYEFIARILGALNINLLSDYTTFYDILASVFLDERNVGSKSKGSVIFGFDSPKLVEIESGGIVYTNTGLQYQVVRKYTFSPSQMNEIAGIYYTPDVEVEAIESGSKYEIGAREITGTLLVLEGLVDIYNPDVFSSADDMESNSTLLQRLKDSVSSRTLSSLAGIRYLLSRNYSSFIKNMVIVKSGDSEMNRDKIYAQTESNNLVFSIVDFARKVSGSTSEERSKALYGYSDTLSPEITIDINGKADIYGFNEEITQEQYNALGGLDSNLVNIETQTILNETWVRAEATSDITPWYVSETNMGKLRQYADFVLIEDGKLKLGAQAIVENIANMRGIIKQTIINIEEFFEKSLYTDQKVTLRMALDTAIKFAGPKIDTPDGLYPQFTKFTDYLNHAVENELLIDPRFDASFSRANVSPVVQRPLAQNKGIIIKGDFTIDDDDKSKPRPLYITNFRANNSIPKAYDGYGIAVMPNTEAGIPNLFITDGNALSEDYFVAGTDVHEGKLFENFLKGTEITINVATKYNYELIYGRPVTGESMAVTLEVRVWASVDERPVNPTLTYGAYIPMNVRSESLGGEAQNIEATDFGFGIIETDGFNWSLGPVIVLQADEVYPQILCMMDVSAFSGENVELIVGHSGKGSDSGIEKSGSRIRIVDFNDIENPVWEDVKTNSLNIIELSRKSFNVDRYSDNDDYMFVLITAIYPNDGSNAINSQVFSDYVAVSKNFIGYHVGSKVDVYIQKKSTLWNPESEHYVDLLSVSATIALTQANGFNLPITKIENIEILDAEGTPTGVYLEEYYDYRLISNSPDEDGSIRENKVVLFSDYAQVYDLRIRYKYISGFSTLQAYVDNETNAGTRTDILLKHPQIKYIDISFQASYAGQDLKDAIKEYVYSAIDKIEAFDIIALAVEYGADSGSLTSMQINSRYYDSDGNLHEESSQNEILKTRIQVFVPETIDIT